SAAFSSPKRWCDEAHPVARRDRDRRPRAVHRAHAGAGGGRGVHRDRRAPRHRHRPARAPLLPAPGRRHRDRRPRDRRRRVDGAADGASAWQMLSDGSYDLAIVDYFLPELDGAQLVQRMKAEPRLATVPVVAVSVGGPTARDATLAAGADLFLDKPLVLRDLF